ncbi:hypothetical protein Cgig2_029037 [Carnegiea gigantea]|uniref:Uncharacterized protein n=1 Tax=Carnegiea gigantea TaxID=171969 RepID=A0A9Q1JV49_9CARY|nr:hypothetical protein Cgig2_029037 [Carnegiea gigantea]
MANIPAPASFGLSSSSMDASTAGVSSMPPSTPSLGSMVAQLHSPILTTPILQLPSFSALKSTTHFTQLQLASILCLEQCLRHIEADDSITHPALLSQSITTGSSFSSGPSRNNNGHNRGGRQGHNNHNRNNRGGGQRNNRNNSGNTTSNNSNSFRSVPTDISCPCFPSSVGQTPKSLVSSFAAMSCGDGQETT